MADYPPITKLSELNPALPAGTEAASKLDDAERQTRGFLKTFLAAALDDDGKLKVGAVGTVSLPPTSVTEEKLGVGSVTETKIGTGAVTVTKLGDGAVETAKLKDGGVTENKLADDAVTSAKLGPLSVDEAALAASAVTAEKLQDDAVIESKISTGAVTETKLGAGAVTIAKMNITTGADADPVVIVKGATTVEAKVRGVLRAVLAGNELLFSIGTSPADASDRLTGLLYARLEERRATGSHAGGSASVNIRGPWSEVLDPSRLLSISGNRVTFRGEGTYLVRISCPAHGLGAGHRVRLRRISGIEENVAYGTSEFCAVGTTTMSVLSTVIQLEDISTVFEVQQFCGAIVPTYGLGRACGDGLSDEVYTIFEVIKV